ncbi:MAG: hypothetical protein Q8R43_00745 [Alphaproteobacteria bacterium]|nr:hypothetical protein [Alphaproteobacteria bacterium]
MAINPLALKLQTNIKLTQDPNMGSVPPVNGDAKSSFADHMLEAVQGVASDGHAIEALSETSNDASELAVAMDQFLVELSALKALVDETRKAIDRVFQEARS